MRPWVVISFLIGCDPVAQDGPAALQFDPAALELGQVEVGGSASATLELRNAGAGVAAIDSLAVTGAAFASATTCGATLDPGASCAVTITAAPVALGSAIGTVELVAGGDTFAAGLGVHGARRISVTRTGNGSGSVTATPGGIACGETCTGLVETEVVLTATPSATETVTWSIAGCPQDAACTVPAGTSPVMVATSFTHGDGAPLAIAFAGDGDGEIEVVDEQDGSVLASCVATCTIPVAVGRRIEIRAATVSDHGGLAGACATTSGRCVLAIEPGGAAVTASFTKHPDEQWTRLLGGSPVRAAAYDRANALWLGQSGALTKLSPAGATLWTRAIAVTGIATAGQGAYVTGGDAIAELDADGATVWTQPLTAEARGCPADRAFVHCLAVAADGVVVVGKRGVAKWTRDGELVWSVPLLGDGDHGVAIDGRGRVHVQVPNPLEEMEETEDVILAASTGAELERQAVSPQYDGRFAATADGQLVAVSSGRGAVCLDAPRFSATEELAVDTAVPNGVAVAGTGDVAWIFQTVDLAGTAVDWRLARFTAGGALRWNLVRTRLANALGDLGTAPRDVAASPDGHIAVVGTYFGFTYIGAWVQTYAP